jgi:hypothetical protein
MNALHGRGFGTILISLMLILLPLSSRKTLDTHYMIIIGFIRCMMSWRTLRGIRFGNWLTLPQGVSRLGQNGCGRTKRERKVKLWETVTPVFPNKTKCKPICILGSCFMHIVTYKWIQKYYHVRKRKIIRDLRLDTGNEGSKHHRQSTRGCVRLALHNIFTSSSCSSFLVLSNVYSKGEHLSYSVSVGKIWMQRLYSGLGYKHLAFLVLVKFY